MRRRGRQRADAMGEAMLKNSVMAASMRQLIRRSSVAAAGEQLSSRDTSAAAVPEGGGAVERCSSSPSLLANATLPPPLSCSTPARERNARPLCSPPPRSASSPSRPQMKLPHTREGAQKRRRQR